MKRWRGGGGGGGGGGGVIDWYTRKYKEIVGSRNKEHTFISAR